MIAKCVWGEKTKLEVCNILKYCLLFTWHHVTRVMCRSQRYVLTVLSLSVVQLYCHAAQRTTVRRDAVANKQLKRRRTIAVWDGRASALSSFSYYLPSDMVTFSIGPCSMKQMQIPPSLPASRSHTRERRFSKVVDSHNEEYTKNTVIANMWPETCLVLSFLRVSQITSEETASCTLEISSNSEKSWDYSFLSCEC